MSLSSFLTKLEQKATGTTSSHQQPQPYPQNPQYNNGPSQFQPPFQSYNYPNTNTYQGPAYGQTQFPNGNPPPPSNYHNQPAYNPPQYAPAPSYAQPPPPQQHKPATRSFLLSYSSGGTSTIIKDPDTGEQVYIIVYPKFDNWTGKSKSGLDQELHAGDKHGRIIGGWKNSETTAKPSMCIGEPKNGAQFQKLKTSSIGSKMGFVSQHNRREYEWKKGDEKFAFRLVDVESGEEVAAFDPHTSSLSMSKLGKLEIQLIGGEDWIAEVLITGVILVGNKVDDTIGKEILKAVLGA
ncbi:hypothetical protein TWF730_003282 [Orbilia blumenaviensis]|uniref:Uncharacterized protein n=1 Tax=Orbilia blumenaviensis TaxID=1796055 RepID=A0AAV9U8W2_9PEZI